MVNLYGRLNFLSLNFDIEQMEMLMKSFYTLTGIRFVLFDTDFREVISYPKESCDFCRLMKSYPETRRKCNYTDRLSFEKCEQANSLLLYKCHAGLVEAVMPLHENEKIIGYLIFGQITDNPDKTALYKSLPLLRDNYGINIDALEKGINNISYKSNEHILAAAKIMEACTSFIIYKELITPDSNKILESVKSYIDNHLGEDIEIEILCKEFNIGRTKLYEIFRKELNLGVSRYILLRRMHHAKKLLKTTSLSIPEIASSVGFDNYNYFSRIFKKTYNKSPKSYRK